MPASSPANEAIVLADEPDATLAARLDDEIARFNFDTTGIRDARDVVAALHDEDGALMAGVQGWTWGATCWVERLWVREDGRHQGLGRRLMTTIESEALARGCSQLALTTHSFQAPGFYRRLGFEVVGELPDYPVGHASLLMRKHLPHTGIRAATFEERTALEAMQRRSSDVWEAYHEQLAANPDAIALPPTFIADGWVRVAVAGNDRPVGFSVAIPTDAAVHELDGLFVEPHFMHRGVGRALVEDAAARATRDGAACLEVTAGPAQGFYEKVGFTVIGDAETRFGPAVRMRLDLHARRA